MTHGARHGWSRLRWLLDIDKMLNGTLDWDKMKTIFKKYQFHSCGRASSNFNFSFIGF